MTWQTTENQFTELMDKLAEVAKEWGYTLIPEDSTVRPAAMSYVKPSEFLELLKRQAAMDAETVTRPQITPDVQQAIDLLNQFHGYTSVIRDGQFTVTIFSDHHAILGRATDKDFIKAVGMAVGLAKQLGHEVVVDSEKV
jgi:hypothetical protein